MKAMLDQHAARLTPAERQAIWTRVSGARAKAPRAWTQRRLVTTAALATTALAIAVLAPLVLEHDPGVTQPPWPAAPDSRSPRIEGRGPERLETPSAAARPGVEIVPERVATPRGDLLREPLPVAEPLPGSASPVPSAAPAPLAAASGGMGAVSGRITDANDRPVPYANVILLGTKRGAMTAEDGTYRIEGLPPSTYSLRVGALGHEGRQLQGLVVEGDRTVAADVRLGDATLTKTMEEVEVRAVKRMDTKSSTTKQTISGERLQEIPVRNLREAVGLRAGAVRTEDGLQFRGGRSGEVKFQFDGLAVGPARPPVVPTTGGTHLPNDEAFDSMFFRNYGVNPFIATDEDALSTFAVDVDAASYTVARRYLELGHLPPPEAVRVEEFVNFFPQGYPRFESDDFRILVDGAPSPFGPGYHLLRIGIKGREVVERDRRPAQLTFVVDVSGSMAREDRLELVKRALGLLVDQLRSDDQVGIVVYGTQGRTLLEPVALGGEPLRAARGRPHRDDAESFSAVSVAGRRRVLDAIEQLRPEGSTNAEHGLQLGYEMARRAFRPGANNRIVLCSDGVANVGRTGPETILATVRSEADRGIHLTTIGFGMGNYNDVLMEQLADRGDGNHYYVDDLDEARRVFVENLTGTLQVIAKDAKIQVEFDSTRVLRYRLLGFENRDVADRDFRNDKVDAGEIGAGHEVTALYEVKLAPRVTRGTIATVRFRYARPEQDGAGAPRVKEIAERFDAASLERSFEHAVPRFRLDAAVAEFAEILRGSYWARDGRLPDVLAVARSAARDLRDDTTRGFVRLAEKAAALSGRAKPVEPGKMP